MHLSMLSRWGGGGGRPGKGGGFDCNHRLVVGYFDRFNDLSSNILLTFGCYFDNPQCPGVGHLNGNSQLSSNAPPMPGLPPPPSGLTLIGALTTVSPRTQTYFRLSLFPPETTDSPTSSPGPSPRRSRSFTRPLTEPGPYAEQ